MTTALDRPPLSLADRLALTVPEAAAACGFSRKYIDDAIAAGKLAAVAPGGNSRSKRIRPADLDAWLQASPYEPA
ncbi:helix-turn-helix domain-containing protein [Nocardia asteroides]|uniref:helix-turn-helix domain-containing protein n=1 Tax=Nocardia asteroides TaxID=1824 RepID=UPI0033C032B7